MVFRVSYLERGGRRPIFQDFARWDTAERVANRLKKAGFKKVSVRRLKMKKK